MKPFLYSVAVILLITLAAPAAGQNGCSPFNIPAGPEWGDFTSNIWHTGGEVMIAGAPREVVVTIYPTNEWPALRGQPAHVMQGTEYAEYDFGDYGSFITDISFVVQHNPGKWYESTMTATEIIRPGTGTGIFENATGHFSDQGVFWLTEPIDPEVLAGSGIFVTHGAICGVKSE
jgi:hypothetical protein